MSVEQAVSRVVGGVSGWAGVSVKPHRFGRHEFNLGHGRHPPPRRVRDQLVAEGKAGPHHLLPETGWITVFARTDAEKRLRRSCHDAAQRSALLEELDGLNLSRALRQTVA
jgi:hypothetical protein